MIGRRQGRARGAPTLRARTIWLAEGRDRRRAGCAGAREQTHRGLERRAGGRVRAGRHGHRQGDVPARGHRDFGAREDGARWPHAAAGRADPQPRRSCRARARVSAQVAFARRERRRRAAIAGGAKAPLEDEAQALAGNALLRLLLDRKSEIEQAIEVVEGARQAQDRDAWRAGARRSGLLAMRNRSPRPQPISSNSRAFAKGVSCWSQPIPCRRPCVACANFSPSG